MMFTNEINHCKLTHFEISLIRHFLHCSKESLAIKDSDNYVYVMLSFNHLTSMLMTIHDILRTFMNIQKRQSIEYKWIFSKKKIYKR